MAVAEPNYFLIIIYGYMTMLYLITISVQQKQSAKLIET